MEDLRKCAATAWAKIIVRSRSLLSVGILVATAGLGTSAFVASPAQATLPNEFGKRGSGAGEFEEASGLAINETTSDVYVMDVGNNRIDEFTGEGEFVRSWGWGVADGKSEALQTCTVTCFRGFAGAGEGEFSRSFAIADIAVDNATEEPLDTSHGSVYVLDQANGRVEKFDAEGNFQLAFPVNGDSITVGPTGTVFVGEEGGVHEYSGEGASISTLPLEESGTVMALAVGPAGEIVVAGNGAVREYSEAGSLLRSFDVEAEAQLEAVTLGANGDVFVDQARGREAGNGERGLQFEMREFDTTGHELAVFDTGPVNVEASERNEVRAGLGFGSALDKLYVVAPGEILHVGTEQVRVVSPPSPGPIVVAESVSEIEPSAAVIHATVNPETEEEGNEARYRVEYGLTMSYGLTAPQSEGSLSGSFNEDTIEVPLANLLPRQTYHFRIVASNECEIEGVRQLCTTVGHDATFTTLPPLLIEGESAAEVRSTSVTLRAKVNPLGSDTTYHFSYGPTSACGGSECDVPVPGIDVGSGKTPVEVAPQHVQGLSPGTTYHYRVLAENELGSVEGEQHTFITQTEGEAGLPDGREWELVSPADKHGAGILSFTGVGDELFQTSVAGDAVVWPATAPTESHPQGDAEMQVLSTRSAAGWSSLDLQIPHPTATGVNGTVEHPFFSKDLSLGLLTPFGRFNPALAADASEQTPYLRTNYLNGDPSTRCTESCFRPLVTGCPAEGAPCAAPIREHEDVPPGTTFAPEAAGECLLEFCGPLFKDATPDLSHVVLSSEVPLTSTSSPQLELYEWTSGKLALVSLLPPDGEGDEVPATEPSIGGLKGEVATHAISDDGSHVFWQSGESLYMRDMFRGETVKIGSEPFEAANATGSKVFFAGRECEVKLNEVSNRLECSTVGEPYNRLLGLSEDGSWVYSETAGSIFVNHAGTTKLIAAHVDGLRARESPITEESPTIHHWRVSPNGRWLAFMSSSPLTGYDNHDAVSGLPDEEVFLYDAEAERLVCASCAPTGAVPTGVDSGPAVAGWPNQTSIAASVPGWTPYVAKFSLYQSRYLSGEGRLFFDTSDALVPRDVNGTQDVYEFEPEGVPAGANACTPATLSGTVVFVPAADGCVGLISSGESPEESTFVDASETGSDIFFLSSATLAGLGTDGTVSLLDAHECSSTSPCLPPPPRPPRPCDTEASCKQSPTPQPEIFGASGSATFSGAGNLPARPSETPKTKALAQKLAKALKVCRRERPKKKRKKCERQARKRYGATQSIKAERPLRRAK